MGKISIQLSTQDAEMALRIFDDRCDEFMKNYNLCKDLLDTFDSVEVKSWLYATFHLRNQIAKAINEHNKKTPS